HSHISYRNGVHPLKEAVEKILQEYPNQIQLGEEKDENPGRIQVLFKQQSKVLETKTETLIAPQSIQDFLQLGRQMRNGNLEGQLDANAIHSLLEKLISHTDTHYLEYTEVHTILLSLKDLVQKGHLHSLKAPFLQELLQNIKENQKVTAKEFDCCLEIVNEIK